MPPTGLLAFLVYYRAHAVDVTVGLLIIPGVFLGGLLGGVLFTWFGGPRWKIEGFFPSVKLIDEREGHGALAGTIAVLLLFIPLTLMGIWIGK